MDEQQQFTGLSPPTHPPRTMANAGITLDEWNDIKARLAAAEGEISAAKNSTPIFNSGDTAWMLTSTALVLLMSLPGLALFYGGQSQAKNVLSTIMQTFSLACMITILWLAMGYSLCFTTGSQVYGGASRFWFIGTQDSGNQMSAYRLSTISAHALAPTIPETVFITYQLTFAIITAAIVCGSFAERMKYRAMLIFMFFWHFLVYCPVAHSEWAQDGFLGVAGDLDFAGGNVVHICSGFTGLAASIIVGPRVGFKENTHKPHNMTYVCIGGSLLWVGWFGFNAGSALTAGGAAGFAMLVTQIAAATGGFTWMLLEYLRRGKPSTLGIVNGAVTGLVIITPAAGFVDQTAAVCMGVIGVVVVYFGLKLKRRIGYDDAMDAFGVHGVGGVMGGLLTGFFANQFISGVDTKKGVFYGRPIQLAYQLYAIVVVAGWSFFMSAIILLILAKTMGVRVSDTYEEQGLDISEHGERHIHIVEHIVPEQPQPANKQTLHPPTHVLHPVEHMVPGEPQAAVKHSLHPSTHVLHPVMVPNSGFGQLPAYLQNNNNMNNYVSNDGMPRVNTGGGGGGWDDDRNKRLEIVRVDDRSAGGGMNVPPPHGYMSVAPPQGYVEQQYGFNNNQQPQGYSQQSQGYNQQPQGGAPVHHEQNPQQQQQHVQMNVHDRQEVYPVAH